MPSNIPAALQTHLDGELKTLASLWHILRVDGVEHFFTDHDRDILYDGDLYVKGFGYDRTAIEDKRDFSVDNMEIRGVFDGSEITREQAVAGVLDGAQVTIRVVNYANLAQGVLVRRKGWLGALRQNNRGEFNVELRGLSQALSEGFNVQYTSSCRVDLGSSQCGVPVTSFSNRETETRYAEGQWMFVPEYPAVIWKCIATGFTEGSGYDPAIYSAASMSEGSQVTDGTAIFESVLRYDRDFTVISVTDRKTFVISVNEDRLGFFSDWYNHGIIRFTYGENENLSFQIKDVEMLDSAGNDVQVNLYLRAAFTPQVGDIGVIYPGCNKSLTDCIRKFNNVLNFRGFPFIPGENYVKVYPLTK